MADEETTTGQPQAGEPAQIETPAQAATNTTPEPPAGDGTETISLEEAKKLRSEAANLRKRIKAFEEAETKAKEAQLSEQERREKQLAEYQSQTADLTRQIQELRINSAVSQHAARLGFADPADATRFLDASDLDFDENGIPTNVETLLKAVLKAKPYLAGKTAVVTTSGGATNPPRSQSNTQALSWESISTMTSQEYNTRRAEIQQWMAEHPMRFGQRLGH